MQGNNIIEKASQLGLNTGDGSTSIDNLRTIASQVGLHDFNSEEDIGRLESALDSKLSDNQSNDGDNTGNVSNLNSDGVVRNQKFGQKEYDQAKKDGVYDPNHYKAKQQELDKKAEELNQERQKNWKMKKGETGPAKEDGSNTQRKSKMDRVMDNLNYAKAKKDAISNKIDGAKANAYNALHPVEHAKNLAKSKAKNAINQAKKQIGNKAKMAAKAAGQKIVAFIAANPWILLVFAGIIMIILVILMLASASKEYGHFDEACDFNLAVVNLKKCNTDNVTKIELKDYVLGVTNEFIKEQELSDNVIKAIMIIVKTNALANGSYESDSKVLDLDTCDYDYEKSDNEKLNELYTEIENYLYLPSRYDDVITSLSSNEALAFDETTLSQMSNLSGESLASILDNLYNISSPDALSSHNIFIGDSRVHGLRNAGLTSDLNTVFADGQGYDWFVDSAIDEANNLMKDDGKYNIFIWLGINDFSSSYVDKYAELAEGEWSNKTIYVMSVGPVDESKTSITNAQINEYNDGLASMIASKGISNLKYYNIVYDISEYDASGLHYSDSDYRKIYEKMFGKTDNTGASYSLYNLASYCKFVETKKIDYSSSFCSTSSSDANLLTFVTTLEGHTDYCDDGNGYMGENIGDGTVSVGPGVTNYLLSTSSVAEYINSNGWGNYFTASGNGYRVNVGDCVPVSVVDKIKVYALEAIFASPLDTAAAQHGISLNQYQRDALTSFNYNVGAGYTESLVSAYATGGYEGLWNYMKEFYKTSGFEEGLKKRRKAEFALFVTGDYTDEGKFYSGRDTSNYDDYDSEGVMDKLLQCSASSSGYMFPLEVVPNLVCTSPFGSRILRGSPNNHSGLDVGGVPDGTPIYAGKAGVVVVASSDVSVNGTGSGCGNMVKIKHEDGYHTVYCHMYPNSVSVNVGDEVSQGQKIGEVGNTGNSTGTHLHIGVIDPSGEYIDPTTVFDLSILGDKESNCHR